jgi:hypothetical protein
MSEHIIVSAATLLSIAIVALAGLKGWQGWLALKERELERPVRGHREIELETGTAIGGARIEMADLRERVRKLEAIASGVEL